MRLTDILLKIPLITCQSFYWLKWQREIMRCSLHWKIKRMLFWFCFTFRFNYIKRHNNPIWFLLCFWFMFSLNWFRRVNFKILLMKYFMLKGSLKIKQFFKVSFNQLQYFGIRNIRWIDFLFFALTFLWLLFWSAQRFF